MDIDIMMKGEGDMPGDKIRPSAPPPPAMAVSHEQGPEAPATALPNGQAPDVEASLVGPPVSGSSPDASPAVDTATSGTETSEQAPVVMDPELAELARQFDSGERAFVQQTGEGENGVTAEVSAENPEGEKALFDLADMAKGAVNAPYAAVNELMDLSYSTGRFVYDVFDKGWKDAKFGEHKAPVRFAEYEPVSIAGDITKGVAQWASGMLMTGGVTKAGGLAANFLTKDVVASTVFFDRQQGLIANLVENVPELANPVTAMLATGKDDSVPEAMLKMAVESLGVGKAADMLVAGIKAVKWGSLAAETGSKEALENYNTAITKLAEAEGAYKASVGEAGEEVASTAVKKEAGEEAASTAVKKTEAGAGEVAATKTSPDAPAEPLAARLAKHPESKDLLSDNSVLNLAKKAEKADRPFSGTDPANYETAYLKNVAVENPQFLKDISDGNAKNTYKKLMGKQSLDAVAQAAQKELREQGFSVEGLYQEGRRTKAAVEQFVHSALKVQAYITNTTDVVMDLATRINRGTASQRDKASFIMMAKNLQGFCILNADMGNVTGRALNARKLRLTPEKAKELLGENADIHVDADGIATKPSFERIGMMTEKEASLWLGQSGVSEKTLMQNVRDFLCSDNVVARKKVLERTRPGFSPLRGFLEMRINGMLSGVQTHIVNVVSSGFNVSVLRPLERTIGGAIQDVATGNFRFRHAQEGLALWQGTLSAAWDGMKLAGKALKMGDNILDPGASQLDVGARHQVTYERLKNSWLRQQGLGPNEELSPMRESLCRMFGWVGTATRLPTRLLMAEDEMFKQMAFRGQLQADLAVDAAKRGFKGEDAKAYIKERMTGAFRADGTANLDDPFAKRALDYARESTWTQELQQGSLSRNIQEFVAKTPTSQIIIPFIRTPVNLMHDAFKHIPPTSLLYSQVRKDIMAKGSEAQAEVLGRWATGSMLMATACSLAADGLVTGAPPLNPKMQAIWKQKGIKPYSIKIGDTWYEYRRFDPIGFIFGAGADILLKADELRQMSDSPIEELETGKIVISAVACVAQGLKDKSYFQGIADFMNAADDPRRYLSRYVANVTTSAIPYSGALRLLRREVDPVQREVEGIFDATKNTIPIYSTTLPMRHDWLTGEPVAYSGVITSKEKDSVVLSELLRVGENVRGRPSGKLYGVELTSEQYSRLCKLNGKIELGGRILHEALEDVITSPRYKSLPDGINGEESPKTKILNKVIDGYRQAAEAQLLREDPELLKKAIRTRIAKKGSREGWLTEDNQEGLLRQLAG